MPVILSTDDMPFLVDSATAAVGGFGLEIQRLLHPILGVRRDGDGRVVALGEPDAPRESLILMDVERAPAKKRADLQTQLDLVYGDVRRSVADWQLMLRELRGLNIIGADVVEVSPPFDPSGVTAHAGVTMMFEILCSMAEDVAKRR